jgi:hypothetical protein
VPVRHRTGRQSGIPEFVEVDLQILIEWQNLCSRSLFSSRMGSEALAEKESESALAIGWIAKTTSLLLPSFTDGWQRMRSFLMRGRHD